MSLGIMRIRAILGVAFAVAGVVIGGELALKPAPLNQKLLGLAFAGVLIALGLVRIRMYLKAKAEATP